MKYILLIGDGMGDLPIASLADKTPLEAAATPTMDRLAAQSEMLLTRTVPEGYHPGSDVANLSLLGYEPDKCYTGRAPLEAAAMGVDIASDELAFRCNLVTLEHADAGRVIMRDYSAGEITTPEAGEIIKTITEQCNSERLTFYPGVSYRHLMIWKGESPELRAVPPHDYTDQDVTEFYNNYLAISELKTLMEHSAELLAHHPVNIQRIDAGKNPANGLWLWGAGRSPSMTAITEQYNISGCMISAVDLLKGIGVYGGLEVIEVDGATGGLDTNYQGKVDAALEALTRHDLAVVHVEAPDEAGHQGREVDKVRAIEDFDARIVKPIVEEMERRGEDFRVVVTMDHYTPICRRTHEDWPVPMFLYDSRGTAQPSGLSYTEAHVKQVAAATGLQPMSGAEFFHHFISQT